MTKKNKVVVSAKKQTITTAKIKQEEEKRQLLTIKERLEGLIKSTVGSKIPLQQGSEWSYDVDSKTIIYPLEGKTGIKTCPAKIFIGTLLHEVGHAKYSSGGDEVVLTVPNPKKEYTLLLNALEDIRIERKLVSRFPGVFDNLKCIQDNIIGKVSEKEIKDLPQHINLLVNILRNEWGLPLHFTNKIVEDFFEDNFFEIHDAIDQKSFTKMHEFLKKNLWEKYQTLLPEEPPEPPQDDDDDEEDDQNEDENENEDENDDEGKSGEDNNEGEGEGESGEGDGEAGESGGQSGSNSNFKDAVCFEDIFNELDKNAPKPPPPKGESLLDSLQAEPEKIEDTQEIAEASSDLEKEVADDYRSRYDFKTYEQLYNKIAKYKGFFAKKLNSILVDNNLKRFGGAFKTGKLDTKLLYKWKCNSTRVFKQPILRKHKAYSVCLLIDESGSMDHNEMHIRATEGAVLLAEVLDSIGIPFEICGFNEKTRIYKKYDEDFNWSIKRNLEYIIPQVHTWNGSHTQSALGIAWANDRLKRREGERIMIVLTDGDNNSPYATISKKHKKFLPKKAINYEDISLDTEIKKAELTTSVIGVGIEYDGVQRHYTQNVVCDNVSQLPKMLLRILQKQIKRG